MAGTYLFFSLYVPNTANLLNIAFLYSLSFKLWSNIATQNSGLAWTIPSCLSLLKTRPDAAYYNCANTYY
jgi:hypothetical protein